MIHGYTCFTVSNGRPHKCPSKQGKHLSPAAKKVKGVFVLEKLCYQFLGLPKYSASAEEKILDISLEVFSIGVLLFDLAHK